MSDEIPVVLIQTDNGPVRINKSDYDPEIHTLVDPNSVVSKETTEGNTESNTEGTGTVIEPEDDETGPAIYPLAVVKEGRKFFIINANEQKVVGDPNINAEGYRTNGDAWAIVKTLNAINAAGNGSDQS